MAHSVEDVRRHYDGLSFGEFSYGDRRAGFYPLFDAFVATINPESRVVDVGCGAGFWLDEFVRRGVAREQLLGLDLAPANVQRARERGHRAEVGNVLDLAQPDAAFDAVFCAGVIHHTPDPRLAFRELVRITRPGGHIYLAVYNRWHPYFWLVHKATAPLRWLHWRGWSRLSRVAYAGWKMAVQPVSLLAFRRFLDERTCYALWMDQVLTPYAHLYTRAGLKREAESLGLEVIDSAYALRALMLVVLLRKR
ncbi:MAG TPA: class I SAM-dependent methyltransferase [Vicinamibacterales bacterium]|nr:class I SAM-dependent methyltransferase [Vicinamibacterales bacterium]